jgi:hypothetical protein
MRPQREARMKPQRAARGLTPRLRARTQAQRKKFAAWATKLRAAHADCVSAM